MISSPALVVTADDRTGATEAAAACADAGWRVEVVPLSATLEVPATRADCVVVDLRSRHIVPEEAQRRLTATAVSFGPNAHRIHKIDSTLRGNWPEELTALVETGRRVVLIPAHPPAGRVAVGGVVLLDGVPVAETPHAIDPRHPVTTSRPSERLPGDELAGTEALRRWLAGSEQVAIVNAATLDDIELLVGVALGEPRVIIAGSASVVGAVAHTCAPATVPRGLPAPLLPRPVVAVCASVHPMARAQMVALADEGVDVVTPPQGRDGDPDAVATTVAERAHARVAELGARSVILVGGDTAEAFVGDSVVEVFGSVGAAVGIGEAVIHGRRLRLATKPGGFGTTNTLVDLVKGSQQ